MIAQLVEHDLAKVGVASSSLVHRSKRKCAGYLFLHFFTQISSLDEDDEQATS